MLASCVLCAQRGWWSPTHRRRSEAQRVRMMRQWRPFPDWKSELLPFSPRLPFHFRAVHSFSLRMGVSEPPGKSEEGFLLTGSLQHSTAELNYAGHFCVSGFPGPTRKGVLEPSYIILIQIYQGCLSTS